MIDQNSLQIISQSVDTMEKLIQELENSILENDLAKTKSTKQEILKLKTQIDSILK